MFDLDGTLTDPFPGITTCIQHALQELNYPVPEADDLRFCIGPPLRSSFRALIESEDHELIEQLMVKYRERFSTVGLFENSVYEGIPLILREFSKAGYTLFVATSKPTLYANQILAHFDLAQHFKAVWGSELDGSRSDKTELIKQLVAQEQLNPEECFMVGDREHDIIGALNNGLFAVGALWGYGSFMELEAAGAGALLDSPADLTVLPLLQ